jgi:hypothetical protein
MLTTSCVSMPPPWALYAWPAIFCQASIKRKARFVHLGTRVTTSGSRSTPCAGQTVWSEHFDEGQAGLAWDWVQIADGVVAMANPLCVVTNLRLVGDHGELLAARESALHLSRLVCQLPWQDEVWRVVQAA